MTTTIITKNSSTAGGVPLAADLTAGELAINLTDKRLFSKLGSTVFEVGTNPSAIALANGTGLPIIAGTTGTLSTARGGTNLTSFTANGVVYASSTSALATGSALTFDGSSLAVTLGSTTTPSVRLYYNGSSQYGLHSMNANGDYIVESPALNGVTSGQLYLKGNAAMLFGVGGSEQMRLTSTGLGIGTSSPAQKLDVGGGTGTPAIRINGGSSTNTGPYLQFARGGTQTNIIGPYSSVASGTANDLTYYSASGYGHIWFSNGQASNINMRLDSSGNLGLGVTPSAWATYKALQVNTTGVFSNVSGTTRVGDNFYYDGSNYRYLTSSYVSMQQYNGGAGGFAWFTAPSGTAGNAITFTQAMTLDASGNLVLGATTAAYKLDVRSGSAANTVGFSSTNTTAYTPAGYNGDKARIFIQGSGATGATLGIEFTAGGNNESYFGIVQEAGGAGAFVWQGYNGSAYAERARIDSAGNLGLGVTSPGDKLEIGGAGAGIILASPNGTRYRITVSNIGVLTVAAV